MKDVNGEVIPESRLKIVGYGAIVFGALCILYTIYLPLYILENDLDIVIYLHESAMFIGFFLPMLGFSLILFKEKTWAVFPTDGESNISIIQIIVLISVVCLIVYWQSLAFDFLESKGWKVLSS